MSIFCGLAETVVLSTPSQVQHFYYYTLPVEKFWAEQSLEIRTRYSQMAADMLPVTSADPSLRGTFSQLTLLGATIVF